MLRRLVVLALLGLAGLLAREVAPEIARYLKLREM